MQKKKTNQPKDKPKQDPDNKENIVKAHKEADKEMEKDPDLTTRPEKGDDLDEGELARLEGEE